MTTGQPLELVEAPPSAEPPDVSGTAARRLYRLLALALTLALTAVLALATLELPEESTGLTLEVAARMDVSGVAHPVTAVLLNFRAYDTWLEVGVLLLATLGVLVARQATDLSTVPDVPPGGLVLDWLPRLLVPVMLLVGGYLLWLGTSAPGGAFQGGAVWGAAGVLLRMAGYRSVTALGLRLLRALLVTGFAVFLLAAAGPILLGDHMLEYPVQLAGLLIVLVELSIAVSVAVTLVALFVGARPTTVAPPASGPPS